MADLVNPAELYAPPGSFMAGERFIDEGTPQPVSAKTRFNDAFGSAAPQPISDQQQTGMAHDLGAVTHRQLDERARTESTATGYMNENRQRMVQAFDAEGIGPDELRPFDKDKVEQEHRHSPVEAFGSLGAVFAMVASAFTHQPMTNSLNAGAAALNAIKKGDDQEYDRAFETWKANTDLTIKRHNIQHQQYTDSISLADTDMRSAEAKLRMQAARFGDEKLLVLLDKYGMSKEVMDLVTARNNQATSLARASEEMNKAALQSAVIRNDADINSGDPARMERGFQRIYGKEPTPEQQAVRQMYEDHITQGLPPPTPEEIANLHQKFQRITAGSGATSLTLDRQAAALSARTTAEAIEAGETPEQAALKGAEAARKFRVTAAAPSGNQIDNLRSLHDRAGMMKDTIGSMENLLLKHNGLAGLGGKILRPGEAISNIFGSNETDRAQFARYVNEVQEWGSRVLTESRGRPLSSEVSKLASILPGLSMGDTTANVVRAYREVVPLLTKIQGQLKQRMEGTWSPAGKMPESAPSGDSSGNDWWKGAPLKGE